jgi:hypothetical protein
MDGSVGRRRLFVIAFITILTAGFLPTGIHTASAATPAKTGIIVPLYTNPTDPSWSALIQAKEAYPNVPVIAIVNPDSGPGSSQDPNFVSGIASLKAAGITVVGYVPTGSATVSLSTVDASVSAYKSWYNVNGIFFDEMSDSQGEAGYYSSASQYADSVGLSLTIGNPGAAVPSDYVGTVNIIVVYENPGYPSTSTIASSTMGDPTSNFAMMAYDVSLPTQSYIQDLSQYLGYVYFTDGQAPNPYSGAPSYLGSLMESLSSMDAGTTSSSGASGITTFTVVASGFHSGSVIEAIVDSTVLGLSETGTCVASGSGECAVAFSVPVNHQYVVGVAGCGNTEVSVGSGSADQGFYHTDGECYPV